MRPKQSEYMYWAETQSQARYNLATSGVGPFPIRELRFQCEQFALHADNNHGYGSMPEDNNSPKSKLYRLYSGYAVILHTPRRCRALHVG